MRGERVVAPVNAEGRDTARADDYRHLFEDNPNAMCVYDVATTRFVAVNEAALQLFGYGRKEFLALPFEAITAPDETPRLNSALKQVSSGRPMGLTHRGLWRGRRKDGSELDVEVTVHDHLFDGKPARVAMLLDVSSRVQGERALSRSEARYRDLFENAVDLIVTIDLEANVTSVNESFIRATGYSRDQLLTMNIEELLAPELREQGADARRQKLAGTATTVYESALVGIDGRRVQVEIASRLMVEDGEPVGLEAICRDISERKRLEHQLRQAQQLEAVGRLAGGVAHDFNTLLTVISGYAAALLESRDRSSDFELDQISAAAGRATILTRQLLAFSRRQVLEPQVVDLNQVVAGIAPMLMRLVGERVELVSALDPAAHSVLADPGQLGQVLLNLAVNARDAMPDGGRVSILTANVELDEEYVADHGDSTVGPHVMLAFSDTGSGMDAETLSHLYEPFFTTKPVGTGTGLGLATVYGIVRQSGGSISVSSEMGTGTTFEIYLPRSDRKIEVDAPASRLARAPRGSERILLAEDEVLLRRLAARMLEKHGYDVVSAESAEEAVRTVTEDGGRGFDLLLTDLVMPGGSGSALAEQVRTLMPRIRVLCMSGYSTEVVTRNGSLEPGTPFLEKPFTSDELAAKVRETLEA